MRVQSWLAFALALSAVALTVAPASVSAQRCIAASDMADNMAQDRYCGVPLITTMRDGTTPLGGTAGFGNNMSCLGQNDDGSGPMINIDPYFPGGLHFFSTTHHSLFVNTNGNITFSARVSQYTPAAFPVSTNPMIAPFWADVDIRNADGSCTEAVGTTCTNCSPCQPFASNGVWWAFEPGRAVFTWDEVGYYTCHDDRRESFQLVLTAVTGGCTGAGDFDVEFRYNRCEWEAGDASGGMGGFAPGGGGGTVMCTHTGPFWICPSTGAICGASHTCTDATGGTPAQAGFDAGDMSHFVEIMNSRVTHQIGHTLCEDSNVGMPGIWRFQVRSGGVVCPDAGMPCTVPGTMGACAMGRTNCVGSGTECVQQVMPQTETCDNVDNDCDGSVDDGGDTALCGSGFVCRAGACVANCFENACPTGLVCAASGFCVESGCETVTCGAGERCSAGACVGACTGVTCPSGASCVEGRCVDACAGLTCDACTVCRAGSCVARCTTSAMCASGEECQTATGACVPMGCGTMTCPAGQHCTTGGTCVDSCTGVTCPTGQMCTAGACTAIPRPDAGMTGPVDVGIVFNDANIPDNDSGTPTMMDAGTVATPDGGHTPHTTRGACGCVAVGASGPRPLALGVLAALGLLVRRRRKSG
jgi:hypothetical protein